MWTPENRPRYDRSKLRYPSDLTDEVWAIIAPLIPRAKRGGNTRTVDVRAVLDGVMYILSTGCQWAALPKDLPPRSTVNDYLQRWDADPEHPGRYLLGIECDGAAYHSSRSARDRDRLRQAVLEDHGWIIHRVWGSDTQRLKV